MIDVEETIPRNLFEVDNARYLTTSEVVNTFVPTDSLWRLLSAKNHIVLGARGSGKTALFRMLAHSHLSRYEDPRARKIIASKGFIGFYLPAKADWIGGLKNKTWLDSDKREEVFSWRLNLAACIALAATLRSCLDVYYLEPAERIRREFRLVQELSNAWGASDDLKAQTIDELTDALERMDYAKQLQLVEERAEPRASRVLIGAAFHLELFLPIRRATQIAAKILDLPDSTTWMLCLDEAEALEKAHHRIINSYLRTHSGNLVFKVSTTPYGHKTLDTNIGAGLSVGNDFEYVYIDSDLQGDERSRSHSTREAEIFAKRAAQSGPEYRTLKLTPLLGPSELLDQSPLTPAMISELIGGIQQFGDEALRRRAFKLIGNVPKFRNEVGRKIRGAYLLKRALSLINGPQEVDLYSGVRMVVRCCDGNPRRLIRVYNKLLREGDWRKSERGRRPAVRRISSRKQTEIMRDFSLSVLARVQGEEGVGRELNEMLRRLGKYMSDSLHGGPLSTDTISSVRVGPDADARTWQLVKAAVGLGMLYPNVHPKTPDEMPDGEGVFRLAYVFAPYFYLLPRRGKSRNIETMMNGSRPDPALLGQASLFVEGQ